MRSKKGFTLAEIAVIVIIVTVIAGLAFPRYTIMMEKARSAEALLVLGNLREAQMVYKLRYGTYAGGAPGSTPLSSYPQLEFQVPELQFFNKNALYVCNCCAGSNCFLGELNRKDNSYHFHIEEDGEIGCWEDTRPAGFCAKLGFKNDYW